MQGTPLRALLIEDSEDDQLLIQRELIRGGFELTLRRVETGPAMQAALESQEWDVILADYLLPGFGGAAALLLLQAADLGIPFIVVSGNQAQAEELIQDAISRVKQLSLELRPAMLDDLGLLPALNWHFQRFTQQTNVHVDFRHMRITQRFPFKIETACSRIVQEALTNAAHYAGVSEVRVRLWAKKGCLYVQVDDAGAGFILDQALTSYASTGLAGMQERTALLGGEFRVESTLGIGTCILATFPITDELFTAGDRL